MPDLTPQLIVLGFMWYVVFLFSTTCHEASHALIAKLGGDLTAARGGQITLNPLPHIRREPWGMVVFPILAFVFTQSIIGWASAPFDPEWERRYPRRAAWMALAGPAANFTLMLIAAGLLHVGGANGWFHPTASGMRDPVDIVLRIFFLLNLLLGCFNLLPVPPLDGSAGIMVFMGADTARRYLDWLRTTPYRALGLLAAFLLFRYFYDPVENFVTALFGVR
jgi:Zn-dependent protease